MLIRNRIKSNEFFVQEVSGMYAAKICFTLEEFSDYIKGKLSDNDRKRFAKSTFVPVKINVNDNDLTIEATFVTV